MSEQPLFRTALLPASLCLALVLLLLPSAAPPAAAQGWQALAAHLKHIEENSSMSWMPRHHRDYPRRASLNLPVNWCGSNPHDPSRSDYMFVGCTNAPSNIRIWAHQTDVDRARAEYSAGTSFIEGGILSPPGGVPIHDYPSPWHWPLENMPESQRCVQQTNSRLLDLGWNLGGLQVSQHVGEWWSGRTYRPDIYLRGRGAGRSARRFSDPAATQAGYELFYGYFDFDRSSRLGPSRGHEPRRCAAAAVYGMYTSGTGADGKPCASSAVQMIMRANSELRCESDLDAHATSPYAERYKRNLVTRDIALRTASGNATWQSWYSLARGTPAMSNRWANTARAAEHPSGVSQHPGLSYADEVDDVGYGPRRATYSNRPMYRRIEVAVFKPADVDDGVGARGLPPGWEAGFTGYRASPAFGSSSQQGDRSAGVRMPDDVVPGTQEWLDGMFADPDTGQIMRDGTARTTASLLRTYDETSDDWMNGATPDDSEVLTYGLLPTEGAGGRVGSSSVTDETTARLDMTALTTPRRHVGGMTDRIRSDAAGWPTNPGGDAVAGGSQVPPAEIPQIGLDPGSHTWFRTAGMESACLWGGYWVDETELSDSATAYAARIKTAADALAVRIQRRVDLCGPGMECLARPRPAGQLCQPGLPSRSWSGSRPTSADSTLPGGTAPDPTWSVNDGSDRCINCGHSGIEALTNSRTLHNGYTRDNCQAWCFGERWRSVRTGDACNDSVVTPQTPTCVFPQILSGNSCVDTVDPTTTDVVDTDGDGVPDSAFDKCRSGETRSATTFQCEPSCSTGQELLPNGTCATPCASGAVRDANGRCGGCPAGQEVYDGSCVPVCPAGTTRDLGNGATSGACVAGCDTDFYDLITLPSGTTSCRPKCGVGEIRDAITYACNARTCDTAAGEFLIGETCQVPACATGGRTYNPQTQQSYCPSQTIWFSAQQSCRAPRCSAPTRWSWAAGRCVCPQDDSLEGCTAADPSPEPDTPSGGGSGGGGGGTGETDTGCAPGDFTDPQGNPCVQACDQGEVWNPQTNTCEPGETAPNSPPPSTLSSFGAPGGCGAPAGASSFTRPSSRPMNPARLAAAVPSGWGSRPAVSRAAPAAPGSGGGSAEPDAFDWSDRANGLSDAALEFSRVEQELFETHGRMLGSASIDSHLGGVNPAAAWHAAGGGVLSAAVTQQQWDAERRRFDRAWNAAQQRYRSRRQAYERVIDARRSLINSWYDRQDRFSRLWGCGTQRSCMEQLNELVTQHDALMVQREGWLVIRDYRLENVRLARAGLAAKSFIDWTGGISGMDVSRWVARERVQVLGMPNPFCTQSSAATMPTGGPNHPNSVQYVSALRSNPAGWFTGNEARVDYASDTTTHWPTAPGEPLVPYVLDQSRDQTEPLWHGGTDGTGPAENMERARRARTLRTPPEMPTAYQPGAAGWNEATGTGTKYGIPNSWSYMPSVSPITRATRRADGSVDVNAIRDLDCEPHLSIAGCAGMDHGARWIVDWVSKCSADSRCSTGFDMTTVLNTAPSGADDDAKRADRRRMIGVVQGWMDYITTGSYDTGSPAFDGDPSYTSPFRKRTWVELACPTTEEKHNYGAVYPEVYDPGDAAPCNVPGSATYPCDADDENDQVEVGLFLDDYQTGCPTAGLAGCAVRIRSRWNDRLGGTGYGGAWERGMYSCEPRRASDGTPLLDSAGRPRCAVGADGGTSVNTGSRQVTGRYPRARFYSVRTARHGVQQGAQIWFNGGFAPIHAYRTRSGGGMLPSGSSAAAPGRTDAHGDGVFAGGESYRAIEDRDYFTDERPDTVEDFSKVMRTALYEVLQRRMNLSWDPVAASTRLPWLRSPVTQRVGGTDRGLMFGWPSFDIHSGSSSTFMRLQETTQLWGKPPGECTGHHDCSATPGQMDMAWVRTDGPVYWFGAMRPGIDAAHTDSMGGCLLVPFKAFGSREVTAMAPVLGEAETWCIVRHDRVPEGTCPTAR